MTSPLREELRHRLRIAMRERDRLTTAAARNVLAALENAEAVPAASPEPGQVESAHVAGTTGGLGAGEVPRRHLSPADERAVVEREVAELRRSAEELAAAGQQDRSSELTRMAVAVEAVLNA